jgi:hypothetical protein
MRFILPILALFLSACAGPVETRIDSRGLRAVGPVSFVADPDATGPAVDAQQMVAQALTGKGYRASEMAEVSLQVTVSDRPANLSLHSGSDVLTPTSGKKLCAKREYRVGITLTKIGDGSIFYQSHAAEFHCKLTATEVLPALVAAALNDIGAPRGSYMVKRRR